MDAKDWQQKTGGTLLHYKIEKKEPETVKLLLDRGHPVNVGDHFCRTPLHEASRNNCLEIVKMLLNHGANINCVCSQGSTPLHYACARDNMEVVKLLLAEGAYIDAVDHLNFTPIYLATRLGYRALVQILLAHGADVNIHCRLRSTILYSAVQNGFVDIIKDILMFCPDVRNEINRSALKCAINKSEYKYREIVQILLEYGFHVNSTDINDFILLNAAVERGYFKIVEKLLNYGVDVNIRNHKDNTLLHTAVECEQLEITQLLINNGADVNAKNVSKETPLHIACQRRHELVDILGKYSAEINSRDIHNMTPLSVAAFWGHLKNVEALLNLGADINSLDIYGRAPLHLASLNRQPKIVVALLQNGADINIISSYGTALDLAVNEHFRTFTRHNQTTEIIVQHLVKMKAENVFVSEAYFQTIDTRADIKQYYDNCEREIRHMKKEQIGNSKVSFYDMLTKGVHQLAKYARNENIVKTLESKDYQKMFPRYADIVDHQFQKGQEREGLLNSSRKSFNCLSRYKVPYLFINEMLSYLSNLDLKNLIEAHPDASNDER